ncbi:hypothetical protein RRG08_045371 [Elysia crispata]|uniref:Uncharacterized protein n=1 Tax=Elysia crispata TaxID=231223 RepID=A0AAE0YB80_9GAST|nr:hypothetical protein RRG08_045371 [Elysia crispata]
MEPKITRNPTRQFTPWCFSAPWLPVTWRTCSAQPINAPRSIKSIGRSLDLAGIVASPVWREVRLCHLRLLEWQYNVHSSVTKINPNGPESSSFAATGEGIDNSTWGSSESVDSCNRSLAL